MQGRVQDKVAIVVGAGQVPGATVGNGRAVALMLAREGARVWAVDRVLASAEETAQMILDEGGVAEAFEGDVLLENQIEAMVAACVASWGRVDILHNNVGVGGPASGDASVVDTDAAAFSRILDINLRGMALTCKHVLPVMISQSSGVITNVASNAVLINYPHVAYQASKAGVVALTQNVAIRHAEYGIRANVILPGLMETPMAVEQQLRDPAVSRGDVIESRRRRTPLSGRPGNAWDVAHAAVYLASEEASFVTGASLVIDGGQALTAT